MLFYFKILLNVQNSNSNLENVNTEHLIPKDSYSFSDVFFRIDELAIS